MAKGYIKLHRAIRDCWIWNDSEPFTKGQAWIDLLLSANHAEKKILFEGKLKTIQAGQSLTSLVKLSDKWKWDRKRVRKFLDVLESDNMITTDRTAHGTTITIVNWGKYQIDGTTEGTADGQQVGQQRDNTRDTNKNDKECIKNDKKRGIFAPPTLAEVKAYCEERKNGIDAEAFIDFYSSKDWMIGKNKMKDWKASVRTWEKRDRKPQPQKASDDKLKALEQYYLED